MSESTYPALGRAEFLTGRTCMPNHVPRYCAEEAQLFAALAKALVRRKPPKEDTP